jgi:hypothetical protein
MPEFDQIQKNARQILDQWMTREGRSCSPTDDPRFSLIVDGKYAVLLSSLNPLNSWDLSCSGYARASMNNGQPYVVFFVCNVADPEYAEIFEVPSTAFEDGNGRPESRFHWEKSCFGNPDHFRQSNTVDSPMDPIFRSTPNWGARGEPFLWGELHGQFKRSAVPDSVEEFYARLEFMIQQFTGAKLQTKDLVYVPRYSEACGHVGISSGFVSLDLWCETTIPLLCERFRQQIGS